MGRHIVRVPRGFGHPTDADGCYIPGAHLEPLSYVAAEARTSYQIYEDTSDGTPVSPVFETVELLLAWLEKQGISPEAARAFVASGCAPLFVVSGGNLVEGIEAMKPRGLK